MRWWRAWGGLLGGCGVDECAILKWQAYDRGWNMGANVFPDTRFIVQKIGRSQFIVSHAIMYVKVSI